MMWSEILIFIIPLIFVRSGNAETFPWTNNYLTCLARIPLYQEEPNFLDSGTYMVGAEKTEFTPGETLNFFIDGKKPTDKFQGLFITVVENGHKSVGEWMPSDKFMQRSCNEQKNSAMTEMSTNEKIVRSDMLKWKAPMCKDIMDYKILATVIKEGNVFERDITMKLKCMKTKHMKKPTGEPKPENMPEPKSKPEGKPKPMKPEPETVQNVMPPTNPLFGGLPEGFVVPENMPEPKSGDDRYGDHDGDETWAEGEPKSKPEGEPKPMQYFKLPTNPLFGGLPEGFSAPENMPAPKSWDDRYGDQDDDKSWPEGEPESKPEGEPKPMKPEPETMQNVMTPTNPLFGGLPEGFVVPENMPEPKSGDDRYGDHDEDETWAEGEPKSKPEGEPKPMQYSRLPTNPLFGGLPEGFSAPENMPEPKSGDDRYGDQDDDKSWPEGEPKAKPEGEPKPKKSKHETMENMMLPTNPLFGGLPEGFKAPENMPEPESGDEGYGEKDEDKTWPEGKPKSKPEGEPKPMQYLGLPTNPLFGGFPEGFSAPENMPEPKSGDERYGEKDEDETRPEGEPKSKPEGKPKPMKPEPETMQHVMPQNPLFGELLEGFTTLDMPEPKSGDDRYGDLDDDKTWPEGEPRSKPEGEPKPMKPDPEPMQYSRLPTNPLFGGLPEDFSAPESMPEPKSGDERYGNKDEDKIWPEGESKPEGKSKPEPEPMQYSRLPINPLFGGLPEGFSAPENMATPKGGDERYEEKDEDKTWPEGEPKTKPEGEPKPAKPEPDTMQYAIPQTNSLFGGLPEGFSTPENMPEPKRGDDSYGDRHEDKTWSEGEPKSKPEGEPKSKPEGEPKSKPEDNEHDENHDETQSEPDIMKSIMSPTNPLFGGLPEDMPVAQSKPEPKSGDDRYGGDSDQKKNQDDTGDSDEDDQVSDPEPKTYESDDKMMKPEPETKGYTNDDMDNKPKPKDGNYEGIGQDTKPEPKPGNAENMDEDGMEQGEKMMEGPKTIPEGDRDDGQHEEGMDKSIAEMSRNPKPLGLNTMRKCKNKMYPIPKGASTSFERSDHDGWKNNSNAELMWRTHMGKTLSPGTGPDWAYDGQNYIYMEGSRPAKMGDRAILQGPSGLKGCFCVRFACHMMVDPMTTIELMVNGKMEKSNGFSHIGWQEMTATVDNEGESMIEIVATRGNTFRGDVAIDDIQVTRGMCVEDVF